MCFYTNLIKEDLDPGVKILWMIGYGYQLCIVPFIPDFFLCFIKENFFFLSFCAGGLFLLAALWAPFGVFSGGNVVAAFVTYSVAHPDPGSGAFLTRDPG